MEWRRFWEGVGVAVLTGVAITSFGDPAAVLAALADADPWLYAVVLLSTLVGVLFWVGTYGSLLAAQDRYPGRGRLATIVVAAMGLRGLVPGGSVSGPFVIGYITGRNTTLDTEPCIAMAYVLEVFLWTGSAVVGITGFVAYLVVRTPSRVVLELAVVILVMTVVVFGVIVYGMLFPERIESIVRSVFDTLYTIVEGRWAWLARQLEPDRVEARVDRFFEAFYRLAADPTHLSPALVTAIAGWFVHATTMYLVAAAVGAPVSYFVALLLVPVAGLAEGLTIFPGGIGVIKPTFVGLLILLSPVSATLAATIVLLYRLSNYWFRIAIGFLALSILGAGRFVESALSAESGAA